MTSSPSAFRLSFFSIMQSSAQRSIVSQKISPDCEKNNTLISMYVFMLHLFHCIGILSGFIRLSKKDNIFYISNSTTTTILTMTQTQQPLLIAVKLFEGSTGKKRVKYPGWLAGGLSHERLLCPKLIHLIEEIAPFI